MMMRESLGSFLSRSVPRLVIVCALGGASAACSSDTLRFGNDPFSNPFSSSQPSGQDTTGSVSPAPLRAPVAPVQAQPLGAPVSSAPLPPPAASVAPRMAAAPISAAPLSGPAVAVPKGWSSQGGSTIALGNNETLGTLANRYGVPEAALRAVNGLPAKGQPAAGSRVIIPVYNAVGSAEAAPAAAPHQQVRAAQVAPAPAPIVSPPGGAHRMQLVKGAQATHGAEMAAAPQPAPIVAPARVAAVTPAKLPAPAPAAAKLAPQPKAAVAAAPIAPAPKVQTAAVANPAAVEQPRVAAAQPMKAPEAPAAEPANTGSTTAAAQSSDASEFRWPAKGRVIAGFNGKGGAGNDGINISLPEGTPVKAAEGGVVAYAGNELKGYGNLVLIRHPNGWVSAYAHNGDLKVKRGDQVARGQTIATSGQSGNVNSPQLHFELRKGSTPVDPMPHLSGL
jgi:murein DD-endopeptidase MepM/ murein hydrolase activator NlpD